MKSKLLQALTVLALSFTAAFAFAGEINLKESQLKWKGTKVTGEHYGKVPFKSGTVDMKDGKVTGGEFVADLTNFTIEDLEGEWATKFLTHMKSEDFFEVKKYPTAKLKIKSIKGNNVTADLTIKGKTNEVKFKMKEKDGLHSGVLKFDRTKFDMIYGSGNFFKNLGDKTINDEVVVDFTFKVK